EDEPTFGALRWHEQIEMLVARAGETARAHAPDQRTTEALVQSFGEWRKTSTRIRPYDQDAGLRRRSLDDLDLQWKNPSRDPARARRYHSTLSGPTGKGGAFVR